MIETIFLDTGGYFALLNPRDRWHSLAQQILAAHAGDQVTFVTTDYVLQETATLLRVRGQTHLVEPWLSSQLSSKRTRIEWMTPDRFEHVRLFFGKHDDKQWSFTDCVSFCVMQELGISEALASDRHFVQAGFQVLLAQ